MEQAVEEEGDAVDEPLKNDSATTRSTVQEPVATKQEPAAEEEREQESDPSGREAATNGDRSHSTPGESQTYRHPR